MAIGFIVHVDIFDSSSKKEAGTMEMGIYGCKSLKFIWSDIIFTLKRLKKLICIFKPLEQLLKIFKVVEFKRQKKIEFCKKFPNNQKEGNKKG